MNMKLMGALVLSWMVSFPASAAPDAVDFMPPKKAIASVPMDIKIMQHGVVKQSYSGNVIGNLTLHNTGPDNKQAKPSRNNRSAPVLFSDGFTTRLELEVFEISPKQTVVRIVYFDSSTLRKQLFDGAVVDVQDSDYKLSTVVSLKPGEAFRVPYSVCTDDTAALCDRELSITTK